MSVRRKLIGGSAFAIIGIGAYLGYTLHTTEAFTINTFIAEFENSSDQEREEVSAQYLAHYSGGELLDAIENKYPFCHREGHPLGRAIYTKTHTLSESLRVCRNRCSDGCFHGAFIEMFAGDDKRDDVPLEIVPIDVETVLPRALGLCKNEAVSSLVLPWKCMHGIGHVLAYTSGNDIGASIRACRTLKDPDAVRPCVSGVYMELMARTDPAPAFTKKDLYPCDLYPEFATQCYHYKVPLMSSTWESPGDIRRVCTELFGEARDGCIRGYGFTYSTVAMAKTAGGLDALCDFPTKHDREECVIGAVYLVAMSTNSDSEDACAIVSNEYRFACIDLRTMVRELQL